MPTATAKAPVLRSREETPPIVTVYRAVEGGLYHTRCRRMIGFQGSRARQELDFYCLTCHEHITLPDHVLPRVPVR